MTEEGKRTERLSRRGWSLLVVQHGVRVYTKRMQDKKGLILHIGLVKDNHWYNYCLFDGDEPYIAENIDFFLIECKMRDDWNKRIKGT